MKGLISLTLIVIASILSPQDRVVGSIDIIERDGQQYMRSNGEVDETIYLMLMERYEGKEEVKLYLEKKKERKL